MAQSTTRSKWPLFLLAGTLAFGLLAWREGFAQTHATGQDSIPKTRQMKVRSLEDAQKELEQAQKDLDQSMRQLEKDFKVPPPPGAPRAPLAPPTPDAIRVEIDEAMKEINPEKIGEEMKKAMKAMEVDKTRMREDMARALKELDAARIGRETTAALSKVDRDKIRQEVEEAQKIEWREMEEEWGKLRPRIEESMKEARKELEEARKDLEKARIDLRETRAFVSGLEKEGLIHPKEGYTIEFRNGQLTINGKGQPAAVADKYRDFLKKREPFLLRQDEEGFSLQKD